MIYKKCCSSHVFKYNTTSISYLILMMTKSKVILYTLDHNVVFVASDAGVWSLCQHTEILINTISNNMFLYLVFTVCSTALTLSKLILVTDVHGN